MLRYLFLRDSLFSSVIRWFLLISFIITSNCCLVRSVYERNAFGFFESCLYDNIRCNGLCLALDLVVNEYVLCCKICLITQDVFCIREPRDILLLIFHKSSSSLVLHSSQKDFLQSDFLLWLAFLLISLMIFRFLACHTCHLSHILWIGLAICMPMTLHVQDSTTCDAIWLSSNTCFIKNNLSFTLRFFSSL